MQFEVLGFRLAPKTPLGRWIVYSSFALLGLALFTQGMKASDDRRLRVERVAGFDMPDHMEVDWQDLPRRRLIGRNKVWSQGYRLPQDLAQELMRTCVERGGLVMERDQAIASYPELASRVFANSPACIRSESAPTRAVSMLQEDRLVVRVHP